MVERRVSNQPPPDSVERRQGDRRRRLAERLTYLRTENRRLEEALKIAHTDPITGLPMRRVFDEKLADWIAAHEGARKSIGLMLADIDNFGEVNNALGHDIGDQVLRLTAETLQEAAREDDLVARTGGDEFAVLMPSFTPIRNSPQPRPEVELLAELITQTRNRHQVALDRAYGSVEKVGDPEIVTELRRLAVRASLGLAIRMPGETPGELYKRADAASYRQKAEHKVG